MKKKKGKKKEQSRCGIMVMGSQEGLEEIVTQYLRLVVADAPDAVRITAIGAVKDNTARPVNISNCHFEGI